MASVYAYDTNTQALVLCILLEPNPDQELAVKSNVIYRDKELRGEPFLEMIYGFGFYETYGDAVRHVVVKQFENRRETQTDA